LYEIEKKMIKVLGFDLTKMIYWVSTPTTRYDCIKNCNDFIGLINNHLNGVYDISLPRFKHSKIYCIDVDAKNKMDLAKSKKAIKYIIKELGKPVFIERSTSRVGGYHLYYKFDRYLLEWSYFRDYFKEKYKDEELVIETISGDRCFKLPFSILYKYYGKYSDKKELLIKPLSIDRCLELFEDAKEISVDKLLWYKQFLMEDKLNKKVPKKTTARISKKQPCQLDWKKFCYGPGERFYNQCRIAIKCVAYKLTKDEFIILCYKLNYGSKDMAKWSKRVIDSYLSKLYDWAERIGPKPLNETFLSQNYFKDFKPKKDELFYSKDFENILTKGQESIARFILARICKEEHKYLKIDDCLKFYKLLLSFRKYNTDNSVSYIDDKFKFLNEGILLSRDLIRLIGKQLHIKYINDIVRIFRRYRIIKVLKNTFGKTYSNIGIHWCQHFKVNFIEDILKYVKNKFFNFSIITKDFISICVKSLIDYNLNIERFNKKNNLEFVT
jgi:hypothetical protein